MGREGGREHAPAPRPSTSSPALLEALLLREGADWRKERVEEGAVVVEGAGRRIVQLL
jgi:hypothetical protein